TLRFSAAVTLELHSTLTARAARAVDLHRAFNSNIPILLWLLLVNKMT
ncbi:MAG: hypothetical protein ACI9WS_002954, partial [Paraglaciecola psychrophila]